MNQNGATSAKGAAYDELLKKKLVAVHRKGNTNFVLRQFITVKCVFLAWLFNTYGEKKPDGT